MEVKVDENTLNFLREIAKLHDCSIEMAACTVLKRYAGRCLNLIESAQRAADHFNRV